MRIKKLILEEERKNILAINPVYGKLE